MRFKVGEKAVYPAHGVALIEGIESRDLGGAKMDFYVLRIVSSGATLMVPTGSSDKAGMRGLITEDDIEQVYVILRTGGRVSQTTWNRRFREFSEKLRTGSVADVAEVLRDLHVLQEQKELSYGEKKMLEKSKELIVAEISAVRNEDAESVASELDRILDESSKFHSESVETVAQP